MLRALAFVCAGLRPALVFTCGVGLRSHTQGSAVLEAGRTFLEEGTHAFFLVLGGKEAVEEASFEAQAFRKGRFKGALDGFLEGDDGHEGHGSDLGGDLEGGRKRFFGGHDT